MQQHEQQKIVQSEVLFYCIAVGIIAIGLIFRFCSTANAEATQPEPTEITAEPPETLVKSDLSHMAGGVEIVLSGIGTVLPETPVQCSFDKEESYLLAKIAMAEAEGEDTEGKALVILTVLNRVQSKKAYFPDSIKEVIFEKGEFTPVTSGRFFRLEPSEDCYKALELVENGWDESNGALYFERTTDKSTWHSRNLEKLFDHGNHTFYKEVDSE